MLSSLLRPRKSRTGIRNIFQFSSPGGEPSQRPIHQPEGDRRDFTHVRHATADWTETENDNDDSDLDQSDGERYGDHGGEDEYAIAQDEDEDEDEDGDEATPLLPIFSAAHLDALPVYNLTHAIRLIVLPRTETTLTWDQLRSPQVSQFLVKPMQQQIRTSHFNRATLYALMANCLQFAKEGQINPGNSGNSRTRAMVCELLAIKLLKEYNTRELIDALSYDFYPLQGLPDSQVTDVQRSSSWEQRPKGAAARISALEVAIRAQAKKFLAHPLVVQQLEAIWAGTIVFHSAADSLHRPLEVPRSNRKQNQKVTDETSRLLGRSPDKSAPRAQAKNESEPPRSGKRTVTLYDPRDASLFKLSRLRVPRYRQFLSTLSLAIFLGLFLSVLAQRSLEITSLELIFWLWSAGFMLDEIVGFNEQGFSLYIMSFWNMFDVGILFLLIIYYLMRLYGIFLLEAGRHDWNNMAYDVLATNAVLLFPRLFSVLDHYRYFSQLLIAFRLMAVDLAAVFVLILISCSGFFVAFTLSFGKNEYDAAGVAYGLFQILMGFTPAAWQAWDSYNPLGRAILTLFLFISHFLIVTILITVLTNSFMAIVSNANDEHQFVFAVNTISMVKNDALFSYVAPSNVLAWILTPLRFVMPFRTYVKINRYVIKITHFPLLFSIFFYEKLILARSVYEPTDLIENHGRDRGRIVSFMDPDRNAVFSPNVRMRQESVSGFQKDRALDEVFRLTPRGQLRSTMKSQERRSNAVDHWMDQNDGIASSPPEQNRSIVDRLERRRQMSRRVTATGSLRRRPSRQISGTKSAGSDPGDHLSVMRDPSQPNFTYPRPETSMPIISIDAAQPQTEDDGDDELLTHDEDENATLDRRSRDERSNSHSEQKDYFHVPSTTRYGPSLQSSSAAARRDSNFQSQLDYSPPVPRTPRRTHQRNLSTNTILFKPVTQEQLVRPPASKTKSSSSESPPKSSSKPQTTRPTPAGTGTHTPARITPSRPRPIMPSRAQFQSAPDRAGLQSLGFRPRDEVGTSSPRRQIRHRRSSLDMDITSDMGLDLPDANIGAVPSSFATQMAFATGMVGRVNTGGAGREGGIDADRIMGRLMLARMKTLEEGLDEVVRGFREMKRASTANSAAGSIEDEETRAYGHKHKGKKPVRRRIKEAARPGLAGVAGESQAAGVVKGTATPTTEKDTIGDFTTRGSSL